RPVRRVRVAEPAPRVVARGAAPRPARVGARRPQRGAARVPDVAPAQRRRPPPAQELRHGAADLYPWRPAHAEERNPNGPRPMTAAPGPMQASKLQNYNSLRGATSYRADYERKLHRRLSDRRERALLARYFRAIGEVDTVLDLPCGHGRLADFLRQ